jgi:IPT/TIG domain-containing protein
MLPAVDREGAEMTMPRCCRLWLAVVWAIGNLSCGTCVPRPVVSSLSPNSAMAGRSQFLLTVNGSDFRRNSLVNWNGAFRTTTFVSSHQLVATITVTDIAQPGMLLAQVFNAPEEGTTSISGAIGTNSVIVCSGKDSNAIPFTIQP